MDNKLFVKNADGKEMTINVIDIIEDTDNHRQYVCYNLDGMEQIFISLLVETEDSFTLETVTEEEKVAVEQMLQETLDSNQTV